MAKVDAALRAASLRSASWLSLVSSEQMCYEFQMIEIADKDVRTLDFAALAKLAEAATTAVRADAMLSGAMLPIWKDGEVAMVDPLTGATRPSDDAMDRLCCALEQQAALTVDA